MIENRQLPASLGADPLQNLGLEVAKVASTDIKSTNIKSKPKQKLKNTELPSSPAHKGPQYNFQDPEYVKMAEAALKKLPEGRAADNIRAQTDFWFYDTLKDNIDKSPEALKKAIESQETILRQVGAPIKGTEGHHPYAISSSRRLKFLPVKEQLQIGAIAASKGFRGGTNPYGLTYLSKQAHSKLAHIDPWKIIDNERYGVPDSNNITNFKLWSQDNPTWNLKDRLNIPFDPNDSVENIVDRYIGETLAPQKMFRDAAWASAGDVEVRKQLKKLTGVDNFKQQNLKLRASTAKLFDFFGLNFTSLVNDVEHGAKLLIPNMKENVKLLKPRQTESKRFNFPEAGYPKYGAGLGDFGSDFIIRNAKGEILGAGLDPKVHELVLQGKYEEAAQEGIYGAVVGGAAQEIIRRVPQLAVRAPQLAIVAAPIILSQLADVYIKHFTGKRMHEHGVEGMSSKDWHKWGRAGSKGMPVKKNSLKINR